MLMRKRDKIFLEKLKFVIFYQRFLSKIAEILPLKKAKLDIRHKYISHKTKELATGSTGTLGTETREVLGENVVDLLRCG